MVVNTEKKGIISKTKGKISEFFLHLVSYGGFNLQNGVMTVWGDPSLFVPMDAFLSLNKNLEKSIGRQLNNDLFYWLGKLYGANSTLMLIKKFGLNKKNVKEFVNGATQDGFGYLNIKWYDDVKTMSGEVIGTNSAYAIRYKKKFGKQNNPVDYYLCGILAGGAEPLFKVDTLNVIEKKCMAKGDRQCLYYFKEVKKKPFDFFKKTKLSQDSIEKKTLSMALRRKSSFKYLGKKDIQFGDGEFVLRDVVGFNIPVYNLVVLDRIMDNLIGEGKKKDIYKIIAKEYINSIKSKFKGLNIKQNFLELEMFGFGNYKINFLTKNKIRVVNENNPFSIDFVNIWGRNKKGVDLLLSYILEEFFKLKYKKVSIVQKTSIIKGMKSNNFLISVAN